MSHPDLDQLCDGPLAPVLEGLEARRRAAVTRFVWIMAGFAVLAITCLIFIPDLAFKFFGGGAILFIGWLVASRPLEATARALKAPAVAAISQARGLTYEATDFSADGYEALHPLLGRPNDRTFRDRFAGERSGTAFAFYHAALIAGSGKSRREVFKGLIYAVTRRALQGETVVMPDRGLFNLFSPGTGMERVRFEDDPDFERNFEVYSTRPDEARAVINSVARQTLKGWRTGSGPMFARLASDQVTVAIADPDDRFGVGPMLKSIPGRERVRGLWEELDRALGQVHQVQSTFG
ncbi:MAG: DUF3137 domain-containing protein [Caulobacterales bacterium]|nr:DUF3137 domain-containing protein [Caulobacterales bacterium]